MSDLAPFEKLRRPGESDAELAERLKTFAAGVVRAMKPIVEYLATPEGNALMAAMEAERAIPDCHCLCVAAHKPQIGVCLGEHSATEERLLQTPRGDVWVNICKPCADAVAAL